MTNNTKQRRAVETIDAYFRSGNSVPVTRATIKLEEWEAVKAALAQRDKEAPSLCTAEEAAELANNCDCIFDPLIDNWLIDNDDLAQIINADRAKR